MRRWDIEVTVGIFMVIGILALAYVSVKSGGLEVFGKGGYQIYAIFSNTGGLKKGASVMFAGVEVGKVKDIVLEDYQAKVIMEISSDVKIQEDAIASIKTKGFIGEKYLEISPGASDKIIPPGGRIMETLPSVSLEEMISKYAFGKVE